MEMDLVAEYPDCFSHEVSRFFLHVPSHQCGVSLFLLYPVSSAQSLLLL